MVNVYWDMRFSIPFLILIFCCYSPTAVAQENILWYQQPARTWTEALPIGNGRMGAMIFGHPGRERVQLNEESVWAGTRINDLNPGSKANLPVIQQKLLEGKNQEAYDLTKKHMLGTPPRIRSYQTLGDLYIQFSDTIVQNYRRQLDLSTAVHTTTYLANGNAITETVFMSAPDNIMVLRLHATNAGGINVRISLDREKDAVTHVSGSQLVMQGQINDPEKDAAYRGPAGMHLRFAAIADVQHRGGSLRAEGNQLRLEEASELVIRFTAKTDYNLKLLNHDASINPLDSCRRMVDKALKLSYAKLLDNHLREYQPLFAKNSLTLGTAPVLPTDVRLKQVKEGKQDDALVALFYQYGRYLLLSSSRNPGQLPANLQGKWNHHFDAPWDSDYHTNINLQMNYWPADVTNTSAAFPPLAGFMLAMKEAGENCAREMYGAKGWAMHHVTDIYGRTSINADPMWGTSPLAGAWMALNLFDHYDFNQDPAYLRSVFPIIKGSADFILNFLIPDGKGQLVTAPSMSPENSFYLQDTGKAQTMITYAPAIDVQIIRELFANIRSVHKEMKLPEAYIKALTDAEAKLPPTRINQYGGIQEWIEDYREVEPGHRHMSHLFGLYPGTTLTRNPEWMTAADKTIERRLANGGGHTGWSRAWMISFYARLKQGDKAWFHVEQLLKKSTLENLFDDHPPFQIDGNFGATAGIAEMLLQSHNHVLDILPAVPAQWTGEVKGLKARGGFEMDLRFDKGELVEGRILSRKGAPLTVTYRGKQKQVNIAAGKFMNFNKNLFQ